jgi:acyl-CoA dehydrogenase
MKTMDQGRVKVAEDIAADVLAEHAQDVDAQAAFPELSISALRDAGLLAIQMPNDPEAQRAQLAELASIAERLGSACASTAMIWAMQQAQLACLQRHSSSDALAAAIDRILDGQLLVASATSEVGAGTIRVSRCAFEPAGQDRLAVSKQVSTLSYGAHSDYILVSARRDPEADAGDQQLALIPTADASLVPISSWEPLGMRGTASPGCALQATFPADRVIASPFADVLEQTMLMYSHILWAAAWSGIARSAASTAKRYVTQKAGSGPMQTIRDTAIAESEQELHLIQALIKENIAGSSFSEPQTVSRVVRLNELKRHASERAVAIVIRSMQVIGLPGYLTAGDYSVTRQLRDSLSAPLMINNAALLVANMGLAALARDRGL